MHSLSALPAIAAKSVPPSPRPNATKASRSARWVTPRFTRARTASGRPAIPRLVRRSLRRVSARSKGSRVFQESSGKRNRARAATARATSVRLLFRLNKPKRKPLQILWEIHGPKQSTSSARPRFGRAKKSVEKWRKC